MASTGLPAISLDQLVALNDEIVALVRAGVPLEQGLAHLGGDLPGRLGTLATSLAVRMERGQSPSDALAEEGANIPTAYRAVIEAGVRAGRLPAALESVARSSRQLAELRRVLVSGLVYPLLVFLLAWGLFVFFAVAIAPVFLDAFRDFDAPGQEPLAILAGWGESAAFWGPAVALAVLLLVGTWWLLSRRASVVEPSFARLMLGWLPWTGGIVRSARTATVAEVLAMLVEHDVPLERSILLAAGTIGDRRTLRAASQIAEAIERGEPIPQSRGGGAFSPFLSWLLAAASGRGVLLAALRHASSVYRREAERQADVAQFLVPILLTLVIGGTVTVLYALLLFLPWTSLLYDLSRF
jgi:type II secretory pathway component PulF